MTPIIANASALKQLQASFFKVAMFGPRFVPPLPDECEPFFDSEWEATPESDKRQLLLYIRMGQTFSAWSRLRRKMLRRLPKASKE